MTTRRHFLSFALAAAALAPFAGAAALAQAAPIGSIQVTFAPTVVQGWGANTALVKAELESKLAELLGPSLQRGASTRLIVNVTSVWLSSYVGSGGGKPNGGGGTSDFLESTATIYDRSGRPLASYPIMSSEHPAGGGWNLPDIDRRRLKALARNNAYWIKRYVAG